MRFAYIARFVLFVSILAVMLASCSSAGRDGTGMQTKHDSPQGAVAVSAGDTHACALMAGGQVKCWGHISNNSSDPIGVAEVDGVSDATAVASGVGASCAIVGGGHVKCWGRDDNLGKGSDYFSAVTVPNLTDVTALSLRDSTACALTKSGDISCWGTNGNFQFGKSGMFFDTPQLVMNVPGAHSVWTGAYLTCSLRPMTCAGAGSRLLATGTEEGADDSWDIAPKAVPRMSNAVALDMGMKPRTARTSGAPLRMCAILDGSVKCDQEDPSGYSYDFQPVPGADGVSAMSIASSHGCALKQGGQVVCWGDNSSDQASPNGPRELAGAEPVQLAGKSISPRPSAQVRMLLVNSCTVCFSCSLGCLKAAQPVSNAIVKHMKRSWEALG